jgi:hypothetical protein
MHRDRYLRIVLTVIALELLWLGVKDLATPVSAQPPATRVVIAGVEIEGAGPLRHFVPIAIVGAYGQVPPGVPLGPLSARITGDVGAVVRGSVRIQADRPLKVEADRPLPVENVGYTPRERPGP